MNQSEFFTEVCKGMDWPATPLSIKVLNRWAEMESPNEANGMTRLFNQANNPLATTYTGSDAPRSTRDIGFGPGKWNNANPPYGVGIYASQSAGVTATVRTLKLSYYTAIGRAFREQAWNDGLESAFRTWIGSTAYSTELAEFFRAAAAAPVLTDIDHILLALFSGSEEQEPLATRLTNARFRMMERVNSNVPSVGEMAAAKANGVAPHRHKAGETGGVVIP